MDAAITTAPATPRIIVHYSDSAKLEWYAGMPHRRRGTLEDGTAECLKHTSAGEVWIPLNPNL